MKKTFEKILNFINCGQRILITSHRDPDGDSIGSQLALRGLLQTLRKPARIINQGCLPHCYLFLDPENRIENFSRRRDLDFGPDLVFILECPSLERLGEVKEIVPAESKIVNIDHHPDNERFGTLNYVDLKASAVGEMIYSLVKAYGLPVSPLMANQIYAAILTDTGRFRYSNTSAHCLNICAELIELGADPKTLTNKIYFNHSLPFLKLLGTILERLEVRNGGKICSMTIDQNLLSEFGINHQEIEGIAHYSLFLNGVEIGLLFTEMEERKTRVSLRS
ncbi:MAG: bifunctional oligoribonuclease/PAP phosphatase NrnA, partial [Candidatus Zixiibacteriota bacterium]